MTNFAEVISSYNGKMQQYDTYIFDLDGTLLDTLDDLAAAVNYALRAFGMPEHSRDDVRRFVGNGVRMLMIRATPDGEQNPRFEEVLDTFRAYYMYHSLDTTRPYDGVPEMLAMLRERGCRLAVVSNKFDAATKELCRHFFADTIEVAVGEHEAEGIRKKPAPDTVIEALNQLGVNPAKAVDQLGLSLVKNVDQNADALNAVYVGDSDVDLETARNAGLPCISVLWGFRDRDFLLAHGATTFVSTPQELYSMD